MAIKRAVQIGNLDNGYILSPDRYNPERETENYSGKTVADFAKCTNNKKTKSNLKDNEIYVVFSTSDAEEGILSSEKPIVDMDGVGSTKKVVTPGDVIISRLRPKLRQVSYVDKWLNSTYDEETIFLCSTEFFVLRGMTEKSIAFLAPVLLSDKIQRVLSASTEGGSRPRFKKEVLLSLPIPKRIIDNREQISQKVISAARSVRKAGQAIQSVVEECNKAF